MQDFTCHEHRFTNLCLRILRNVNKGQEYILGPVEISLPMVSDIILDIILFQRSVSVHRAKYNEIIFLGTCATAGIQNLLIIYVFITQLYLVFIENVCAWTQLSPIHFLWHPSQDHESKQVFLWFDEVLNASTHLQYSKELGYF